VIFVMRQMARRDDLIFRLLFLRLKFKAKVRNIQQHEGMWVLTPNHYRGQPEIRRG
jgi:type IV secretion system protein VirB3